MERYGTASQEYLSAMVIRKQGNLEFWPDAWCKSFRFHCLPWGFLANIFDQPYSKAYRRNHSRWGLKTERRLRKMAFRPDRQVFHLLQSHLTRILHE